ncbi:Rz lytic protein [Erwinia psidii]|uniref:Rz lytic protein n=1 Tax=Erwinia psidii TaxID=69224 RepID=UPI00226B1844|nr:Rz lytic protein [Erwinia psidii]
MIEFFKAFGPLIVIVIALARIFQLEDINQHLTDSKDAQICEIRRENNYLASGMADFIAAVEQQNELLKSVTVQREISDRQNRELQNEIINALENEKCAVEHVPDSVIDGLRRAAKNARAAGGIPDDNAAKSSDPGNTD